LSPRPSQIIGAALKRGPNDPLIERKESVDYVFVPGGSFPSGKMDKYQNGKAFKNGG
jgi:hypothetical protein